MFCPAVLPFHSLPAVIPRNALNKSLSTSLDPRQMKTWSKAMVNPQWAGSIDET